MASPFRLPVTPHSSSQGTPGKSRTGRTLPFLFYRWGLWCWKRATGTPDGLPSASGIFLSLCLRSGEKGSQCIGGGGLVFQDASSTFGSNDAWGLLAGAALSTHSVAWWQLALCWLPCGLSHPQPTVGGKVDQVLPPSHTLRMEMWKLGLVVRIPGFHCHGPGQGAEIPQATQRGQKREREREGGRKQLIITVTRESGVDVGGRRTLKILI